MNTTTQDWAEQLKAAAIAYRRASRPAWVNAHADRQAREREARWVAKEYRQAQRQTEAAGAERRHCTRCDKTLPMEAFPVHKDGKRNTRCRPCVNAKARAHYHRKCGRSGTGAPRGVISAERQDKAAERIAHLTSLLMATNQHERISSEGQWNMAASELQRLWAQSGDKECVSCKASVPHTAMLPPGPANFYPGKCQSCATAECHDNHIRVTGRLPDGPRPIPMRDGTVITVAELARRHRERERR